MSKEVAITAKSVEAAIAEAAQQFGVEPSECEHEVLEEAKKGFIGLGAQDARVRVWVKGDGGQGQSSAQGTAPDVAVKFLRTLLHDMDLKADVQITEIDPNADPMFGGDEQAESDPESADDEGDDTDDGDEPEADKQPGEGAAPRRRRRRRMKEYYVNLAGEDVGALIGHHGDVLDAVQYLCNLAANNDQKPHIRVTVDAEQYRAKRAETLRTLARRVAQRVQQQRRNVTLEPMNSYERRIIHAEIQQIAGVTTFSVGQDMNRKVVVCLEGRENAAKAEAAQQESSPRRGDSRPFQRNGPRDGGYSNNSAIQGDRSFNSSRGQAPSGGNSAGGQRSRGGFGGDRTSGSGGGGGRGQRGGDRRGNGNRSGAPSSPSIPGRSGFTAANSNGSRLDESRIGGSPKGRKSFFDDYDPEGTSDVFSIDLSFHTENSYDGKGSATADGILSNDGDAPEGKKPETEGKE